MFRRRWIELVHRPRLLERLSRSLRRRLTIVAAPAGFGKTTLLSDWSARSPLPVAWLSLDAADNDPTTFWDYLLAVAWRSQGTTTHALTVLSEALRLAAPGGYIGTFVDEGTLVADLLELIAAAQQNGRIFDGIPAAYVAQLLAACKQRRAEQAPVAITTDGH